MTVINNIAHQVKLLHKYLQRKLDEKQQISVKDIDSLAPKVLRNKYEIEAIKPYLDSLITALKTEGITNIAITGSHGSGKSTIIKTFQELHKSEYEFLNISLASFIDNQNLKQDLERKLEISILQQMFYHVKPSAIPDSRFKRINNTKGAKLFLLSSAALLWIISAVLLLNFNYLEKLNPATWERTASIDWVALLCFLIFFTGLGAAIRRVYRLLYNSKISKLNIKGELEIGERIDNSVFNQHLEEILYFFESTAYDVVIIEDVDRFNSTDIFTKLREINLLINKYELINRTVKFIYAIKDELFINKNERVKFFEYIIPVISFINPSNAKDQLQKLIKRSEFKYELTNDFTSDIVTFIDDIDMRLLINIFHEYQIYRRILGSSLNQDKLFAILVYKNMYPDDFGQLLKRKGKLYQFITNKQIYIKQLKGSYESRIKEIDEQVYTIGREHLKSIEELRIVYLSKLVSHLPGFISFSLNVITPLADAVKEPAFNQIKNDKIKYKHIFPNRSGYWNDTIIEANRNFSSIEKEVDPDYSYDEREKAIKDKLNHQLEILKKEKEQINIVLSGLNSLSLQEIFQFTQIEQFLTDFENSLLIRNLLLNGHIDEDYEDYISLFHEESLTRSDFEFERKVKGGINLPFDYKLKYKDNLIKKIPEKYFKREPILNYDILKELLNNDSRFNEKQTNFFQLLSIDGEKQFAFIHNFIKSAENKVGSFITLLCKFKPTLWEYIYTKSGLPESEILNWVRLIFNYADYGEIKQIKDLMSLKIYLEEIPEPFLFFGTLQDLEKIKRFIKEHKIQFQTLDKPDNNQTSDFKFIYEHSFYKINLQNIKIILLENGIAVKDEELNQQNYTIVRKSGLKELNDNITNNLEEYISNIITGSAENNKESEETIIEILNNVKVSESTRIKLIKSQDRKIQELDKVVAVENKQLLLKYNKAEPKWLNLFDYYGALQNADNEQPEFDSFIIDYLNEPENYKELGKVKIQLTEENKDFITNITYKIIYCNKLTAESYRYLLNSNPYVYRTLDYSLLTEVQASIFLNLNKLILTKDNYHSLKEMRPDLAVRLIEIRENDIVTELNKLEFGTDDWLIVYNSKISKSQKLELLNYMEDKIIVEDPNIAAAVCKIFPEQKTVSLRFEVLEAIMHSKVKNENKIAWINNQSDNLDPAQLQKLTELLGDDYKRIFMKQNKPVFPKTEYHIRLFQKLAEFNLIIRYEIENENSSIRVIAKY